MFDHPDSAAAAAFLRLASSGEILTSEDLYISPCYRLWPWWHELAAEGLVFETRRCSDRWRATKRGREVTAEITDTLFRTVSAKDRKEAAHG